MLHRVAAEMAAGRGTLLSAMARDAGKTVAEADPEVSEAIDFARYYGDHAIDLDERFEPHGCRRGRLAVELPVRHPGRRRARRARRGQCRHPQAGARDGAHRRAPRPAVLGRRRACRRAAVRAVRGRRRRPTPRHPSGRRRRRAHRRLGHRPAVPRLEARRCALHAETSGKNAIVVTAAADLDDAIRDIVRSAFGHAGQKCSAASLAIVEASVHDDPRFQARLADAVAQPAGRAGRRPGHRGRAAHPPAVGGRCCASSRTLDPGERWLVRARPGRRRTRTCGARA